MDYTVKRGDTLSALARTHGTTVDAIMDANSGKIVDRDKIYTGDTIKLPEPAKDAKDAGERVQPDAPKAEPAPLESAAAGAEELEPQPQLQPGPAQPVVAQPTYVAYEHVAPAPPAQVTYAQPTYEETTYYEQPAYEQPASQYLASQVVAAPSYEDNTYEQQVVDLVNQVRASYGLPALAYDARLDAGAEYHTAHQAAVGLMGHEGIGDGTPQERMLSAGWNWAWGENAAVGQATPEQVVREWMASPGHRANILNPDFRFLSVGYATGANGRPYWTQSFGVGS